MSSTHSAMNAVTLSRMAPSVALRASRTASFLRRGDRFASYVIAVLMSLAVAGLIGGTIAWGFKPLTTFSGTRVSALHALGLTFAALGVFALPLLGVAAFGIFLSVATRNSAASIVGSVVYAVAQEAVGGLVHVAWLRRYLLSTQFDAWQGVFRAPVDWTQVGRAAWVSFLYVAVPLVAAPIIFRRRGVAGPCSGPP